MLTGCLYDHDTFQLHLVEVLHRGFLITKDVVVQVDAMIRQTLNG
jgi:hypothetical protein